MSYSSSELLSEAINNFTSKTTLWAESLFRKAFNINVEAASIFGLVFTFIALALAVAASRTQDHVHATDFAILTAVMLGGLCIGPVYGVVIGLFTAGFYGALIECTNISTFMNCLLRTSLLITGGTLAGSIRNLIYLLFKKVKDMAEINPLTGLKNRNAALTEIKARNQSEEDFPVDVLSFKVKNMDNVRRKLGHAAADKLLAEYAGLIGKQLGKNIHISQLSDDSLLAVTQNKNLRKVSDYQKQLASIKKHTAKHEHLKDLELATGLFRNDAKENNYCPEEYLDISYGNMLQALSQPESFYASSGVPQPATNEDTQAINDAIQLRFQVILNVHAGSFTAIECLINWQPADKNVATPLNQVLPQVRLSHEVEQLVNTALNKLFDTCLSWQAEDKTFQVSVNVTPDDHIYDGVIRHLHKLHHQHPTLSQSISIGLSEKSLESSKNARTHARFIKHMGFKVIVSDLNVYRSDLMRLAGYNCDGYKIHSRYAESALEDSERKAKLNGFLKALRLTGKPITFYAIKTKPVFVLLRKSGISEFQGKLISKPLEKDAIPWDRIKDGPRQRPNPDQQKAATDPLSRSA